MRPLQNEAIAEVREYINQNISKKEREGGSEDA